MREIGSTVKHVGKELGITIQVTLIQDTGQTINRMGLGSTKPQPVPVMKAGGRMICSMVMEWSTSTMEPSMRVNSYMEQSTVKVSTPSRTEQSSLVNGRTAK